MPGPCSDLAPYPGATNRLQGLQIVQTQQTTVSHQDQAAQIGKLVHHFFENRQQGLGLNRIAV
jgi:hypothetical protein